MEALAAMPRYEAYKDSGVEWIGSIPEDWNIKRLKLATAINPSPNIGRELSKEKATFLPMELVHASGCVEYDIQKPVNELRQGFTSFKRDDVIVAKITPCFENGKGALLDLMPTDLGFGSTEFHVLRANAGFDAKFIYYLTKTHLFMKLGERLMTGSAGQKRVQAEFVANFPFAYPTLKFQKIISNFLDKKTSQIDEAIAIKEKQIELLKERKQIIIQKAMTQGLDPNVKMKDSGVDWIGRIPEHWEATKLKHLFSENTVRTKTGTETLLSLRMELGLVPHNDVSDKLIPSESLIDYKVVVDGQLVMNRMRAAIGIFGVAHRKGLVSPDYAVFDVIGKVLPKYYLTLFKLPLMGTQFRLNSKGMGTGSSGFMRLYTENFGVIKVPNPPVEEQHKLMDFITQTENETSSSVQLLQNQIDKIKEYKTTLINSAVTGKIEVPALFC